MTYKIEKTDEQWKTHLKAKGAEPLAFEVTRHEATERPFTGKLEHNTASGIYRVRVRGAGNSTGSYTMTYRVAIPCAPQWRTRAGCGRSPRRL